MRKERESSGRLRTELDETKQQLALLVDGSLDAIVAINECGDVICWNPKAVEVFGWTKDEAIGQSLAKLIIPEDQREEHQKGIERFVTRGVHNILNRRIELTALRRDQSTLEVELTVFPQKTSRGYEFTAIIRDISERKSAIQSLKDAHDLYEDWYENSPDFYATVDARTGIIQSCNATLLRGLGKKKQDVVGHSVFDLYAPESEQDAKESLKEFRVTGAVRNAERKMIRSDGSTIDVILNVSPVRDERGFIIASRSVWRDVTERIVAQRELQSRESRIEALLHSTAEGIYGLDLNGNCSFANSACAKILGFESSDELLGRNMHELIHHSLEDGTPNPIDECHVYKVLRVGDGVHIDTEVLWRRDGTSFPAEYWSFPVKVGGELVGSVVTFLDITERKQLQVAQQQLNEDIQTLVYERTVDLEAARNRLVMAFEFANIGLWDWNAQTDEVYFSDTYKQQLGFDASESWSHFGDWEGRLHPEDYQRALQTVKNYFADPLQPYHSKFRLKCRDDSYRWFLAQGKAKFDDHGKPLRMLGVHIDITQQVLHDLELKRLNNALATANDALQKSNVELQQFAYVASHDLQTPLRAIAGFAQLLQQDYSGQLSPSADEYINRIVNGAKRMQKMIDDLLAFSRVESRAAPFQRVDLDLVFDDAVELLRASIDDTDATVTSDPLPTVSGDAAQLAQVFQNLIGNSLKYCKRQPHVHVSAEKTDDHWIVSVKDNGIGISSEFYDQVFEVFRRLHGRDAYPGTGIGLSVCRRIIARHGGEISVNSVEGKGSTFSFSLPV